MSRPVLAALVLLLYAAHQDVWFWRTAQPLAFGVLPVGLFYHVCYAGAAAVMMWLLVRYAWPAHLEEEAERADRRRDRR